MTRKLWMNEIPAATRAGHQTLWDQAHSRYGLAPSDKHLCRVFKTANPRPARAHALRPDAVPLGSRFLGKVCEVAHVLRVGREGPLIPPGEWVPVDGDWLHVHPDNWRRTDDPAARLPGSASVPQDDSELF